MCICGTRQHFPFIEPNYLILDGLYYMYTIYYVEISFDACTKHDEHTSIYRMLLSSAKW